MLLVFSLFVLGCYSTAIASSDCQIHIDNLADCSAVISTSGGCSSVTANLTDTVYAKCQTTNFFWSYPLFNLTLIIETSFTQEKQIYSIDLDNAELAGAITHVYRIYNQNQIDITTKDKIITQKSDDNGQIILKFQGPTVLSRYGVNLSYKAYQK